jgi:putative membrane protein
MIYFLGLIYFSGAIGFVLNPSFFLPFTPFTLLYTSIVFLIFQPLHQFKYLIAFFSIALIGFVFEVIGVATGAIFGDYVYGTALGYRFFDVPLTISINWALLISCAVLLSSVITKNRFVVSLISALLVTSIDLLIEQVAPALDFWKFNSGLAGWHNYIGWLLLSFMMAFLFSGILLSGNKKPAIFIVILQIFFFGFIYLFTI